MFADPRVREALAAMFDFEWINANLYAGAFRRSQGFFDDSELSSIGRPGLGARARAARAVPRRGARRGVGRALARDDRPTARAGTARWRDAPSTSSTARAMPSKTGASSMPTVRRSPSKSPSRIARRSALRSPTPATSARIGVTASVRLVDEVQFQRRRTRFRLRRHAGNLDRLALARQRAARPMGLGVGQRRGRLQHGGRRLAGDRRDDRCHCSPPKADEDFVAAARALDRILISGFYIVPLFYAPEQWIAYSSKLGRPGGHPSVRRRSRGVVAAQALRPLRPSAACGRRRAAPASGDPERLRSTARRADEIGRTA